MLRSREELKTLRGFLDWLLEPALAAKIRPSQTEARLRKVRREISHLEEMTGFYVNEAVPKLRKEENLILAERKFRTYQNPFVIRNAPREVGNIEETERLFLAVRIIRALDPTTNPYISLKDQLEKRGNHRTRIAIQMRVTRFEKKLGAGQYFSCRQIAEQHYFRFKGFQLWNSPFGHNLALVLEKLRTSRGRKQASGYLEPWPKRDFDKMNRFLTLTNVERKLLDDLCRCHEKTRRPRD